MEAPRELDKAILSGFGKDTQWNFNGNSGEWKSHLDIRARTSHAEVSASADALGREYAWDCVRNRKRTSEMEASWAMELW